MAVVVGEKADEAIVLVEPGLEQLLRLAVPAVLVEMEAMAAVVVMTRQPDQTVQRLVVAVEEQEAATIPEEKEQRVEW